MTISQTITALPDGPDPATDTPDTFSAKAAARVLAEEAMVTEINTWAGQANTLAAAVNADATSAQAQATAAIAAVGATVWVSGTTYAVGDVRYSPADLHSYRRLTSGGGTTDPSADSTNWQRLTGGALVTQANTWSAGQRGAYRDLTDAATIAVDLSTGNFFRVLLGGNRTLGAPTNAVAGQSGQIDVRQDGAGSRTLAYAWPYQFAGGTAPTLSTGKYALDSLAYTVNVYASSTVTITIASPGVVSWAAHGLYGGQRVQLTTTGALPTGLSASTSYYVIPVDANSFRLATSLANAQAGTAINTSGSQSGTHTATAATITIVAVLGVA